MEEVPASLGAYIIAILGFLGAVHAKYESRKVAKDKQDSDNRAAEIAASHDAQLVQLRTQHLGCEERYDKLEAKLNVCQEQHQQALHSEAELKKRVAALETKIG